MAKEFEQAAWTTFHCMHVDSYSTNSINYQLIEEHLQSFANPEDVSGKRKVRFNDEDVERVRR